MEGIRWMSGNSLGTTGAHALARSRHAAMPALAWCYRQDVVVGKGTPFATVGANGRPRGLEGGSSG